MTTTINTALQTFQKEGAELFSVLYAEGSAVRHLSEARRENSADLYDPTAFDTMAASLLEDSLDQSERVMGMFATQPLSK